VELKSLGVEILASKYKSQYSSWSIENPQTFPDRESKVDSTWKTLSELASEKKRVLDDHLAREEFAERVRLANSNHINRHAQLQNWCA